jgi:hypothetical protein
MYNNQARIASKEGQPMWHYRTPDGSDITLVPGRIYHSVHQPKKAGRPVIERVWLYRRDVYRPRYLGNVLTGRPKWMVEVELLAASKPRDINPVRPNWWYAFGIPRTYLQLATVSPVDDLMPFMGLRGKYPGFERILTGSDSTPLDFQPQETPPA